MEISAPARPAPPIQPHADSLDSLSPSSGAGESRDDRPAPPNPTTATLKLRLMCSYGGHIVPRPHDKALCYLGGETRIVSVDRDSSLADLKARLSLSLLAGRPFSLKYQLPSEDLDSLISVSSDEDLENMLDEYDRAAAVSGASGSSRLRLFLFPASPEPLHRSASSSSSPKSDSWFVDALNAAGPLRQSSAGSAASSIDCLLSLGGGVDADVGHMSGKPSRHCTQDVQSMPDSPMLETASSFGSASSVPSLASLPPIRVQREEERPADPRGPTDATGLQERLAQMNVYLQQPKRSLPLDVEGSKHPLNNFHPTPPLDISTDSTFLIMAEETPLPTENPSPRSTASSIDQKPHQEGMWRSPPHQHQQQLRHQQQPQKQHVQENSTAFDVPLPGDAFSRSVYCQEKAFLAAGAKVQETPVFDPGFLLHQPPSQQQAQQQQPNAVPHLATHHHAAGTVLPIPLHYNQMFLHSQQQLPQVATHSYPPQVPLYFLTVPGSAYSPSSNLGDPAVPSASFPSTNQPTIPPPSSLMLPSHPAHKQEVPTNFYKTGIGAVSVLSQPPYPTKLIRLNQSQQYVGYHPLLQSASQPPPSPPVAAGCGYEFVDGVHGYQMYYPPASPATLPAQYQMMGSGAVEVQPHQTVQQPTDAKKGNAS